MSNQQSDKQPASSIVRMGDVEVNLASQRITRAGEQIEIEPRAWEMLTHMMRHPGTLFSKEELRAHVWDNAVIGDAAISQAVLRIRNALGDTAKSPRFIETIHRRGYRLIAPLDPPPAPSGSLRTPRKQSAQSASGPAPSPGVELPPELQRPARALIGRQAEADELWRSWDLTNAGGHRFVFVEGVLGSGKSTLVRNFVDTLKERVPADQFYLAEAQCVEHVGPDEAFLPVFDILHQLGSTYTDLVEVAESTAGGWMNIINGPASNTAGYSRSSGSALFRESIQALIEICARRKLIVIVEDLQWCDPSSLALLNYIVQSRRLAGILIVGTWRLDPVSRSDNRIKELTRRLFARRYCSTIELKPLTRVDVTQWVNQSIGERLWANDVVDFVCEWSDGNPLFIQIIIDHVRSHADSIDSGEERLSTLGLPRLLHDAVEISLAALSPAERFALDGCSVMGADFFVSELHVVLDGSVVEELERICERLVQCGMLVPKSPGYCRTSRELENRIGFTNSLYKRVVYEGLPGRSRQRMHRTMGDHLCRVYAEKTPMVASTIAYHYQQCGDAGLASSFFALAGENVLSRGGLSEAASHFRAALDALHLAPASPERDLAEFKLRVRNALVRQYLEPDGSSHANLLGALHLVDKVWRAEGSLEWLSSLYLVLFLRAIPVTAESLEKRIDRLCEERRDTRSSMQADFVRGCQHFLRGAISQADDRFVSSAILMQRLENDAGAMPSRAPGAVELEGGEFEIWLPVLRSWIAFFKGDAADANALLDECAVLSRRVGGDHAEYVVSHQRLLMHQQLGDVDAVELDLEALAASKAPVGSGLRDLVELHRFWLAARRDAPVEIDALSDLFDRCLRINSGSIFPLSVLVAVHTCLHVSQTDLGLSMLDRLEQIAWPQGLHRDDAQMAFLRGRLLSASEINQRAVQPAELLRKARIVASRQGNIYWLREIESAARELW